MRADAAAYTLDAPETLDAVLAALAAGAQPLAGGTEVMVALCAGRLEPRRFVSLHRLAELHFLDSTNPGTLRLGARTTFTDLRRSTVVAEEFPLLAETAGWTGTIANQNRGTIGGNIANGSPAADNPPALLVYEADLELVSPRGTRTIPYRDFHTGYKRTGLAPDELIGAIRLPRRFNGHVQWVRKVGTRNAQAISKVALAARARIEDGRIAEIALAAASLLDRPARLPGAEAALLGKSADDQAAVQAAQAALQAEARPIDDIRSTARYRSAVAANLLAEFVEHLRACATP